MHYIYVYEKDRFQCRGGASSLKDAKTLLETEFAGISLRWERKMNVWTERKGRYRIIEK